MKIIFASALITFIYSQGQEIFYTLKNNNKYTESIHIPHMQLVFLRGGFTYSQLNTLMVSSNQHIYLIPKHYHNPKIKPCIH